MPSSSVSDKYRTGIVVLIVLAVSTSFITLETALQPLPPQVSIEDVRLTELSYEDAELTSTILRDGGPINYRFTVDTSIARDNPLLPTIEVPYDQAGSITVDS